MSLKVVKTLVKVSQGDEVAGQAPRVQVFVWSKGHGKGKTDVISKEGNLPDGAGLVEIQDYGINGNGSMISWSCSDGTMKQIIASKEGHSQEVRGFIAETST